MASAAQFSGPAVTPDLAIRRNNVHTLPRQTSIKMPGRMKLVTVGAITRHRRPTTPRKDTTSPARKGVGTFISTTEAPPQLNDTNPTPDIRRLPVHSYSRRARKCSACFAPAGHLFQWSVGKLGKHPVLTPLAYPVSGIGPGWKHRVFADLPWLFRYLPDPYRLGIAETFPSPSGGRQ